MVRKGYVSIRIIWKLLLKCQTGPLLNPYTPLVEMQADYGNVRGTFTITLRPVLR
jgi:hypothetical protein